MHTRCSSNQHKSFSFLQFLNFVRYCSAHERLKNTLLFKLVNNVRIISHFTGTIFYKSMEFSTGLPLNIGNVARNHLMTVSFSRLKNSGAIYNLKTLSNF